MAVVEQLHPQIDTWGRAPDQVKARLLREHEKRRQSALKRGKELLRRKTFGEDEGRVLGRMQQIAQAYEQYHAALSAIIRIELL